MATPRLRLGQLLLDARLISQEVLEEVLAAQKADGRRLGTLLVERGLVNETQLTQILSHQLSVPWVSLLHIEFSRQLLNLVPHDVAERFCLVPIYVRHVRNQGETLYVAMDDPSNEEGLRACTEHSGLPVRAMIAPPQDIRSAIRVYYGVGSKPAPTLDPASAASGAERLSSTPAAPAEEEAPLEAPPSKAESDRVEAPSGEQVPFHDGAASGPKPRSPSEPADEGAASPPREAASAPEPEPSPVVPEEAPVVEREAPVIETVEIELPRARQPEASEEPASERVVGIIPKPKGRAPRMVSLTLLDGTTITLPAKPSRKREEQPEPDVAPSEDDGPGLTARDLVAALRAVSHGADASEILGSNVRWEAMFAALLSLLLKKHLIADWEFVDEMKKI